MKTIIHPDYWVEIPAGEFLLGLSEAQCDFIRARIYHQLNYTQYSSIERELVKSILSKVQSVMEQANAVRKPVLAVAELTDEEKSLYRIEPFHTLIGLEIQLMNIPIPEVIWLEQFYIARFPFTRYQQLVMASEPDISAHNLPSPLEGDSFEREAAIVQSQEARQLCQQIGGRLPTDLEWEKAARGPDGRLYPWGNDWDVEAGYFFRDQPVKGFEVDAFPKGVSPYGVWAMAGDLPELVTVPGTGFTIKPYTSINLQGCHPKESSETWAWLDHIVAWRGRGHWVGMRPVLDKWPVQQWRGIHPEKEQAEVHPTTATKPLLNQFEWLVLKMQAGPELEPAMAALEAEQKAVARNLLRKILQKDPGNEYGWLLLAIALDESVKQQECVQRALRVNPESEIGLKLKGRITKDEPADTPEADEGEQ